MRLHFEDAVSEGAFSGIEPQTIYITPPNHDLILQDGRLRLTIPQHEIGPKPSVDHLFLSLAESVGARAIGIILSGTGSDGSHGVRALRAHGGITIQETIEALPEKLLIDLHPRARMPAGTGFYLLSSLASRPVRGALSGSAQQGSTTRREQRATAALRRGG